MKNREISGILTEIAELLSLKGENVFKIRAYEKAALNISTLTEDIEKIISNNEKISGVGEGIHEKIKEYLETGSIKYLDELKKDFPEGLLEIMTIQGLGPKKAKLLYEKLGVKSVKELKKAAQEGKIRDIETFGEKTEENILKGITFHEQGTGRMLISTAFSTAENIISELKREGVIIISEAGSLRRRKETIRDIDILCATKNPQKIIEKFCSLGSQVLAKGGTKSSILTDDKIQVDLRIVAEDEYGAALQYFTGSKQHNVAMRGFAKDKNFKISEYGIFETNTGKKIGGKTEEEIYEKLGMVVIPPELREDTGEIQAALKNALPALVEQNDIKGDTHIHTKYSDGNMDITEIAGIAQKMGYQWAGICDHSQSLKVAGGTSLENLKKKTAEIREFNEKSNGIKLLCGSEVDILSDGTLDYPDEILKELDIVIAAIHTGFKQDEKTITGRIIKAIKNRYVHIIAHPTGRLLNWREPYNVNIEEIIDAAAENGVALEINAYPKRLDLPDIWCKKAKEKGVMLAIGSDSHFSEQLEFMKFGVFVARRGWLEKKNLLNCLDYSSIRKFLSKKR